MALSKEPGRPQLPDPPQSDSDSDEDWATFSDAWDTFVEQDREWSRKAIQTEKEEDQRFLDSVEGREDGFLACQQQIDRCRSSVQFALNMAIEQIDALKQSNLYDDETKRSLIQQWVDAQENIRESSRKKIEVLEAKLKTWEN